MGHSGRGSKDVKISNQAMRAFVKFVVSGKKEGGPYPTFEHS